MRGPITAGGMAAVLRRSTIGGPTPWVVAVMTCLAILGLAAAMGLAPASNALSGQIAGRATIQILETEPMARRATVASVRDALRDAPYIATMRVVPETELAGMAQQWLGDGLQDSGLSLPALIDVDLIAEQAGGMDRLKQATARIAPNARVIPHAEWLGPVAGMMRLIGWIALGMAALLVAAAAAVAVLAARASLAAQRPTIDVLHLVGATDVQIARLFQRHTARDTLLGVTMGGVVALAIVGLIAWRAQAISSGLAMVEYGMRYALLLLVPPVILAVAVLTARLSVLRALRHMP